MKIGRIHYYRILMLLLSCLHEAALINCEGQLINFFALCVETCLAGVGVSGLDIYLQRGFCRHGGIAQHDENSQSERAYVRRLNLSVYCTLETHRFNSSIIWLAARQAVTSLG